MQPIGSQILFKPFPPPEMTEGGLFVPDSVKKVNNKGVVVRVGKGTKEKPMQLKEGDIAFRVKDWGMEVFIGGELHFLMDQEAILAIN